jgi:hypothetical protein
MPGLRSGTGDRGRGSGVRISTRAHRTVTRVEARVEGSVGVQPDDPIDRGAAVGVEETTDSKSPVMMILPSGCAATIRMSQPTTALPRRTCRGTTRLVMAPHLSDVVLPVVAVDVDQHIGGCGRAVVQIDPPIR